MGMKNRLAIIGMGCTRFGTLINKSWSELALESFEEALQDAGIDRKKIDACWYNNPYKDSLSVGNENNLKTLLKLPEAAITSINLSAGSEKDAFQCACYAVASGHSDIAIALGAEKHKRVKDNKIGMPPGSRSTRKEVFSLELDEIKQFAIKAGRYFRIHGLTMEEGKRALARIAYKNHRNGSLNSKSYLNYKVSIEDVMKAPIVEWPLGLMDCSQVTDGAATAIICRADLAIQYRKDPIYIKALQALQTQGKSNLSMDRDSVHLEITKKAAILAYKEAGISDPREQINILETHDRCTVAELLNCEDLHISPYGKVIEDMDAGFYDLDGKLPSQSDGGVKCCGDPVGATAIRMIYEVYKQLQCRVENKRQVENPENGLVHYLGGRPFMSTASVTILSNK